MIWGYMFKELYFENSPYSLIYDEDVGVVLSKKDGVFWIDYSGNEIMLGLLKKIKELEDELYPLRKQSKLLKYNRQG